MLPYPWVLTERAVAAAGHVAKDAIEQELVLVLRGDPGLGARGKRRLLRGNFDSRENRGIQVCDHERRGREPSRLVDEKMGALVVTVIGNEEPGWDG